MTALVVAATNDIYRDFERNVRISGEEVKLRRLTSIDQIRGTIPEKVVVLPQGWVSMSQTERANIVDYCRRKNISIYNVTQSKLDTFADLLKQEKENAASKANSRSPE